MDQQNNKGQQNIEHKIQHIHKKEGRDQWSSCTDVESPSYVDKSLLNKGMSVSHIWSDFILYIYLWGFSLMHNSILWHVLWTFLCLSEFSLRFKYVLTVFSQYRTWASLKRHWCTGTTPVSFFLSFIWVFIGYYTGCQRAQVHPELLIDEHLKLLFILILCTVYIHSK